MKTGFGKNYQSSNFTYIQILVCGHSLIHRYIHTVHLCAARSLLNITHTLPVQPPCGQFGVQYVAQGHFGARDGGYWDRTAGLLVSGQPAVPPEPQPKVELFRHNLGLWCNWIKIITRPWRFLCFPFKLKHYMSLYRRLRFSSLQL